jgi:hypothetical protein
MGATEVLRWIEGAAAIVSLGLCMLTVALAIKFKEEIKKAEKRLIRQDEELALSQNATTPARYHTGVERLCVDSILPDLHYMPNVRAKAEEQP